MNKYFWDFITEGWICIYMDDILITALLIPELWERTRRVLQWLLNLDLYFKLDKCQFEAKEIDFLGMIISWNQIWMDTSKLMGIKKWTPPKTVKQVWSFLGFCNFYWKFIGHYTKISKPLTELTKKTELFVWTEERNRAFEMLKEKFMEEPVLMMPDPTKQFILETDASNVTIRCYLLDKITDIHYGTLLHHHGHLAVLTHMLLPLPYAYHLYKDRLVFSICSSPYAYLIRVLGFTQRPVGYSPLYYLYKRTVIHSANSGWF